jgi:hypothetical protein
MRQGTGAQRSSKRSAAHKDMRELKSASWKDFCRRVSQQQHGGTLDIDVVEPDGRTVQTANGAIFDRMALDTSGACSNVISIQATDERELNHQIIEPIYIRLRESSDQGDYNPVEIQAESGRTLLTFHPAIHEELLKGLDVT